MTPRNLSVIAYLTIIGWGYAYYKSLSTDESRLLCYHLRQALGIFIVWVCLGVIILLAKTGSDSLSAALSWVNVVLFVLLGMGIINALNEANRPIPMLGKAFENRFLFIQ